MGPAEDAPGPAPRPGGSEAPAAREPRWMQSRWADWVIPGAVGAAFGQLIPYLVAVVAFVVVAVAAIGGQTIVAVVSAVVSAISFALGLRWRAQAKRATGELEDLQKTTVGVRNYVTHEFRTAVRPPDRDAERD